MTENELKEFLSINELEFVDIDRGSGNPYLDIDYIMKLAKKHGLVEEPVKPLDSTCDCGCFLEIYNTRNDEDDIFKFCPKCGKKIDWVNT